MTSFFSSAFDWVSDLGDDVGTFFDKFEDNFGISGSDIVKAAKESMGGSSKSGSATGSGGGLTFPDPSKYVGNSNSRSAYDSARALARESTKNQAMPSVDMKELHREWAARLREFSIMNEVK